MSRRILIVDDEADLVEALSLKLQGGDYDIDTANNGMEALEQLSKSKADIVLLDLIMPKLDGFGFLDAMQKRNVELPVIVLSNLGQAEDIERAQKYDAVKHFFVKADTPLDDIVKKLSEII